MGSGCVCVGPGVKSEGGGQLCPLEQNNWNMQLEDFMCQSLDRTQTNRVRTLLQAQYFLKQQQQNQIPAKPGLRSVTSRRGPAPPGEVSDRRPGGSLRAHLLLQPRGSRACSPSCSALSVPVVKGRKSGATALCLFHDL